VPKKDLKQFIVPMMAAVAKKPFNVSDWILAFTVRARSDHGAT
jgi:hypothetical protein